MSMDGERSASATVVTVTKLRLARANKIAAATDESGTKHFGHDALRHEASKRPSVV